MTFLLQGSLTLRSGVMTEEPLYSKLNSQGMEYVNFHRTRDEVIESTDRPSVNCFSAEVLSNAVAAYFPSTTHYQEKQIYPKQGS